MIEMKRKLYKLTYFTSEYLKEHNRYNDFIIKFESSNEDKAWEIAQKILTDIVEAEANQRHYAFRQGKKVPLEFVEFDPLPKVDSDFPMSAIESLYCIDEDWCGHDMTYDGVREWEKV